MQVGDFKRVADQLRALACEAAQDLAANAHAAAEREGYPLSAADAMVVAQSLLIMSYPITVQLQEVARSAQTLCGEIDKLRGEVTNLTGVLRRKL